MNFRDRKCCFEPRETGLDIVSSKHHYHWFLIFQLISQISETIRNSFRLYHSEDTKTRFKSPSWFTTKNRVSEKGAASNSMITACVSPKHRASNIIFDTNLSKRKKRALPNGIGRRKIPPRRGGNDIERTGPEESYRSLAHSYGRILRLESRHLHPNESNYRWVLIPACVGSEKRRVRIITVFFSLSLSLSVI